MVFPLFFLLVVVFLIENNCYSLPSNTPSELIPICVPLLSDYDNCTTVGECEDCIRCVCNSSRSWECTRLQRCQDHLKLMDTSDSYVLGNLIDENQGLEKGDVEISRRKKRDTLANTIAKDFNDTSDENLDEIFNKNKTRATQNQNLVSTEASISKAAKLPQVKATQLSDRTPPETKINEIKTEDVDKETKTEKQGKTSNTDSARRELNEMDKKTIENEMEQNEIKTKTSNNDPKEINRPFDISANERMKGLLKNKSPKDEYKKLSHTIAYEIKPGVEFIGDRSVKPSVNINFKLVSGQTSSAHFAGELINRIWDLLQNGLPEDSLKRAVVQNMGTLMNYSNEEKLNAKMFREEPDLNNNIGRSKPEQVVFNYMTGVTNEILTRVGGIETKLEDHIKNDNINLHSKCCDNVQSKAKDVYIRTKSCDSCKVTHEPNGKGENINVFFKVDSKDFFSKTPSDIGNDSRNSNTTNAHEVLRTLLQDKSWISFIELLKPLITESQKVVDVKNVAISNETSHLIEKIDKLMDIFLVNTTSPKIDTSKFKIVLDTEEKIRSLIRRDGSGNINEKVRTVIESLLNTLHSNLKNLLVSSLEITRVPDRDMTFSRSNKFVTDLYEMNPKTPKDVRTYVEAIKCIGNILELINTPNSGVIFKVNEILGKLRNGKQHENISDKKTSQSPLEFTKRSIPENRNNNNLFKTNIVKNLTENIDKTIHKISKNLIENDEKNNNRRMMRKEDILRHILINKIKRKSKLL